MTLIMFYLACYGVTMILVQSSIMRPIKDVLYYSPLGEWLYRMLNCMLCTGFWVSMLLTWVLKFSVVEIYFHTRGLVISSVIGATIITFIHLAVLAFEKKFDIEW